MIAPGLGVEALSEEIRRIGTKHSRERGAIGRLITLLADVGKNAAGRDDETTVTTLYERLLGLNVLELLLLQARAAGDARVRAIDTYPDLPGLRVVRGVFSPEFATDSYLWARHMVARGSCADKAVLEMGAGTGLISLQLLLHGGARHVTAVDVNPAAVENVRLNAGHFAIAPDRLTIIESDLFDRVPRDERYDVILWAMPWVHVGGAAATDLARRTRDPVTKRLLRSVLDVDLVSVRRFISGAKERLHRDGEVLLITCEYCRSDVIAQHATHEGFRCDTESLTVAIDVVPRIGMTLNLQQIRLRLA